MRILSIGLSLLIILGSCSRCAVKKESINNPWAETIAFAESHLPKNGTLVQAPDGFAYLKVDDGYIHKLYPMLRADKFIKPPYFRRSDSPGAHISVIYENEKVSLNEIGQVFDFELRNIKEVETKDASYLVLVVDTPKLQDLRKKYGLKPKLNGHEFHITLAKRPRKIERESQNQN